MKIGIVSLIHSPIKEPFGGGIEKFSFQITSALQKRGHKITLFASGDSDSRLPIYPVVKSHKDIKIPSPFPETEGVKMRQMMMEESLAYIKLLSFLIKNQNKFDLIHNNSYHFLPALFSLPLKIPVSTTLHSPPSVSYAQRVFKILKQGRFPLHLTAVSQKMAKLFQPTLPVEKVILNGINKDDFPFSQRHKDYLVFIGRITKQKGVVEAIKIAKSVKKKIYLAGPLFNPSFFKKEVSPLLSNNVIYLGHLISRKLSSLLSGALAVLATSCYEDPCPLVVLEAMASGTPVVGFRTGGIEELVEDGKTGFLAEQGKTKEAARAVLNLKNIKRENCRKVFEEKYTIDRMADEYEKYFEELISNPSCGYLGLDSP